MDLILIAVVAGGVSYLVARAIRRFSPALGLVQAVNHRSSHTTPTPSGGGTGIVVGTLIAGVAAATRNPFVAFVLVFSIPIAVTGFWDDRKGLAASVRFAVQGAAVSALVGLLVATGAPAANLPTAAVVGAGVVAVIAGLWWVNLFNFQDGIDGYAGTQAVLLLLAPLVLGTVPLAVLLQSPLAMLLVAGASACVGFLVLNWPPAKVFMGDVGSTFLGFVIFALAGLTILAGWLSLWQWLILVSLFVCDATVTLLTRLVSGERVTQAHRSHAYQRLARRWRGHRPVTLAMLVLNLLVIWPVAYLAGSAFGTGLWLCVASYAALATLMIVLGAGQREEG